MTQPYSLLRVTHSNLAVHSDLTFTHGANFTGDFVIKAVDGDPQWWRKGWT